jgi:hypothetical protein
VRGNEPRRWQAMDSAPIAACPDGTRRPTPATFHLAISRTELAYTRPNACVSDFYFSGTDAINTFGDAAECHGRLWGWRPLSAPACHSVHCGVPRSKAPPLTGMRDTGYRKGWPCVCSPLVPYRSKKPRNTSPVSLGVPAAVGMVNLLTMPLLSLRRAPPTGATRLWLATACTTCGLCPLCVFPAPDGLRHRGRGATHRPAAQREPTRQACVPTAVVASPVTIRANGYKAPLFSRPLTPRCPLLRVRQRGRGTK